MKAENTQCIKWSSKEDRREWTAGTENKEAEKPTQRQTIKPNEHLLIELPGSKYNYYEWEKKDVNNLS